MVILILVLPIPPLILFLFLLLVLNGFVLVLLGKSVLVVRRMVRLGSI
jgi:hypothetical protein